eukprot:Gb_07075 [translate_table: standard]
MWSGNIRSESHINIQSVAWGSFKSSSSNNPPSMVLMADISFPPAWNIYLLKCIPGLFYCPENASGFLADDDTWKHDKGCPTYKLKAEASELGHLPKHGICLASVHSG